MCADGAIALVNAPVPFPILRCTKPMTSTSTDGSSNRAKPLQRQKVARTPHMGYRWKAGSETRTMAVSLGRSDVLAEQECDRAESPGSRDVSGSVFAPKPTIKINGGGTSTHEALRQARVRVPVRQTARSWARRTDLATSKTPMQREFCLSVLALA